MQEIVISVHIPKTGRFGFHSPGRLSPKSAIHETLVEMNANDMILHRDAQGWVHGAHRMLHPV